MCTHWYIYGLLFLEKIYIPIKKINRYRINKLEYYRDELNEYSPLIIAKILDKDIYDQDVIVAMLLYIDEKELDKNSTELLKNEKMLESPERMVYSCLDLFPKGIDELMKETELSISELMERLITLELKGYAEEVSRNYYIRLL